MFWENFYKLCRENGKYPNQVAVELGLSTAISTRWKNGSIPRGKTLQKIADYFGVTIGSLLADAPAPSDPAPSTAQRREYGRVKVVSQAAAGLPIEAIDVFDPDDPDDWEELEQSLLKSGEYFGLRIHGNSMAPDIKDGDIVIVRKQETANEGEIVIVTENGQRGTCKKIHFRNDGITLLSLNPDFPPIKYSAEECRTLPVLIAGKVVRLHREY